MSAIASRCQIAPDDDFALKEMATNLDQRTLQAGKARHDIGGENIDTCRPITIPNAQPDTSQLSMPRMRRMTEASPRPILSTPFSDDMAVRGMPAAPLAQVSRPAYSEGTKVEPIVSPVLSLRDNVAHHACAEGSTSHLVNSEAKVPKLPPGQLLQRPDPSRLPEESRPVAVERKPIDRSPSHEKLWVDSSKDVKFDEWRPPHIDLNTLLDLKRPNLVTEERKPSFVVPSYDEVPRLDQEQTNSTRSPTLSSEGVGSLPRTPHVERENYPELTLVQTNHSNRPSPRRVDPDSFPEPLSTLQTKRIGTASIVSDDSEPSRFVSRSATSKSKKWGGLFKSNRTATTTSIPHAVFSASGKSLILWNEGGAGCYDLHNAESIQFRRINARNIRLAAGGAAHLAVVTKTGIVSFSNLDALLVAILTTLARATEWKCLRELAMPLYETGD